MLDPDFLSQYPKCDIVYSWGVLHHTGHLYQALENAAVCTKASGQLFISCMYCCVPGVGFLFLVV